MKPDLHTEPVHVEPRKAVPPTIRKRGTQAPAQVKPQNPVRLSIGLQIKREFRDLGLVVD